MKKLTTLLSLLIWNFYLHGCLGDNFSDLIAPKKNISETNQTKTDQEITKDILANTYTKKTNLSNWIDLLLKYKEQKQDKKVDEIINRILPGQGKDKEKIIENLSKKMAAQIFNVTNNASAHIKDESPSLAELEEVFTGHVNFLDPFSWIIINNDPVLLESFLNLGFSPNHFFTFAASKKDEIASFPADLTLMFGNKENLMILLNHGVNLELEDEDGETALFKAVSMNYDADLINLLIEHGADINHKNIYNETLLHAAAESGSLNLVKFFVQKGLNLNAVNEGDETPLHLAAEEGFTDIVKFLLEAGADSKITINDGCDVLLLAIESKNIELVKLLLDNGFDVNTGVTQPLYVAVENGSLDIVKLLLEKGAAVNLENPAGETALDLALKWNKTKIADLLLASGARIKEDKLKLEKIHNTELRFLLIKKIKNGSTDTSYLDPYRNTLLHCAALLGDLDWAKNLIEKGTYIDSENNLSIAPLCYAALAGHLDMVKFLLEKGAFVDTPFLSGNTPLHFAASRKFMGKTYWSNNVIGFPDELIFQDAKNPFSLEIIDLLLQNEADPNKQNSRGEIPLHIACLNDDTNVVKKLIDASNNINEKNFDAETPLHFAVRSNSLNIVKELIKNGADITAKTNDGYTPFHLACSFGNLEIVKEFLNNGVDLETTTTNGSTALLLATNSIEVFSELVNRGADINAKDKQGFSVFHYAAKNANLEIIKKLLNLDLNINITNNNGITPLYCTTREGFDELFNFILSNGADIQRNLKDGSTLLHSAAYSENTKIIQKLLKLGLDINKEDNNGVTPLHIAIKNGSLKTFNFLLKNGANQYIVTHNWETGLHFAMQDKSYNGIKIAKKLLKNKLDINATTLQKETPLYIACNLNNLDAVKFLLQKGIKLNTKTTDGLAAIHIAILKENLDIVKELVNFGADVNMTASQNFTPLHLAAQTKNLPLVEFLISKGANLNAKTDYDVTPLHIATNKNSIEIVEKLIGLGADVDAKLKNGKTCLHIAAEKGYEEMVQEFLAAEADTTYKDNEGLTPADCATKAGHTEIAAMLSKAAEEQKAFISEKLPIPTDIKLNRIYELDGTCPKIFWFYDKKNDEFMWVLPKTFFRQKKKNIINTINKLDIASSLYCEICDDFDDFCGYRKETETDLKNNIS